MVNSLKSGKNEEMKIDKEWDDAHVIPSVINPDVDFLFQVMIDMSLKTIDAQPGKKILDIGCGRAIDGVSMAEKGAVVLGLEPSRVMINHAEKYIADKGGMSVFLIHGTGEYLPFKDCSLDKVLCKGALDHFIDPEKTVEEICRVLESEGEAVLALANYESLGFRLSKFLDSLPRLFRRTDIIGKKVWEVPDDHTYKFDYYIFRDLVKTYLKIDKIIGVSLLYGLYGWGDFLARLPRRLSFAILKVLDKLARLVPSLSDVVIIKCSLPSERK